MGLSVQMLDERDGHLVPDSEDMLRACSMATISKACSRRPCDEQLADQDHSPR